jgi:hypothetical protein
MVCMQVSLFTPIKRQRSGAQSLSNWALIGLGNGTVSGLAAISNQQLRAQKVGLEQHLPWHTRFTCQAMSICSIHYRSRIPTCQPLPVQSQEQASTVLEVAASTTIEGGVLGVGPSNPSQQGPAAAGGLPPTASRPGIKRRRSLHEVGSVELAGHVTDVSGMLKTSVQCCVVSTCRTWRAQQTLPMTLENIKLVHPSCLYQQQTLSMETKRASITSWGTSSSVAYAYALR